MNDNDMNPAEKAARKEMKMLLQEASRTFYAGDAWANLRAAVKDRDITCQFCDGEGTLAHALIPDTRGGDGLDMNNLAWCCMSCSNILRGVPHKTVAAKREYVTHSYERQKSELEETYL